MGIYRYKYFEIVHQIKVVIDSQPYIYIVTMLLAKRKRNEQIYQVLLTISLQFNFFFLSTEIGVFYLYIFFIENNNCFGFVFYFNTISVLKN